MVNELTAIAPLKPMLNPLHRSALLLSTALLTLGSGCLLPALSQVEPETGEFQTNERDTLFEGGLNPFDLIHRARQMNNTFDPELQNESLNEASQDFRRRQLEAIQRQQEQQNQAAETETPEAVQPE
ncbi:hypothetical protein PN441_01720 [Spirulina major CS-329]|uniref:hypothetical protein n=2 Tax=Spirulinaceae TaxID=1890448 RepID=UPI002330045A|nr:hypothetical protein [Spirulina major]MDB9493525.1 hypothetical protein [Spirulina subsalsa CS-330]MDB9501772.1 hypothetical protein [Spirulina major CS-329]